MLLKAKSWDRMAALLEREAAQQPDPAQRIEILRRVAQIHREKLGNAKRAIEIYREILRADPQDAVSMRAIVEIYEHEGDFASLAQLLREQIDRADSKQERVSLLRRLLVIYDERLADLAQGQWAANEILKAVPGDRDTLTRLEGILERAGRAAELVQRPRPARQARRQPRREDAAPPAHRRACSAGPLQDPAGAAARWRRSFASTPTTARRSTR